MLRILSPAVHKHTISTAIRDYVDQGDNIQPWFFENRRGEEGGREGGEEEGGVYHVSLQNLLKIRSVRRKILFLLPFIEFATVFIWSAYQDAWDRERGGVGREIAR